MKASFLGRFSVSFLIAVSVILVPVAVSAATNANGLNRWAIDGALAFRVNAIHCGQKSIASADGFDTETAQGMFCVLSITVKNIGSEAQIPDDSSQFLYDTQGRRFSSDSNADIYLNTGTIWQFNNLNPGLSISGNLY